ncbi:NUDIX hydrolase [Pseudotabrizicola sp. L79]|uniref:NUDIX hydrolase n=1 Tax=Pseudotabrizicola sp. L79 TaxID=3118402 RepID=UPI002F934C2D
MKAKDKTEITAAEADLRSQYGAVCWRLHRGKVEVLLVTSRDTGRWVIPKGWPCGKLSGPHSAAQEAWEEAGVEGQITETSLGVYTYLKRRLPKDPLPCAVTVFPLRVARLAEKFPERKERQRKWFAARKAARKVDEPELRQILSNLDKDPSVLTNAQSA